VIGVDFAPSAIAQFRKLAKDAKLDVKFLQADIFNLPKDDTHH